MYFAPGTTKLEFNYAPVPSRPNPLHNILEFIPNPGPVDVGIPAGRYTSLPFAFDKIRFTNGQWYNRADIGFTLTTHSSSPLWDNHRFLGTLRLLNINSRDLSNPNYGYLEADFFFVVGREDMGSARVFDLLAQPRGVDPPPGNVGTFELDGYLGSLIPTGFIALEGGFTDPSTEPPLGGTGTPGIPGTSTDMLAPTTTAVASPPPNGAGWNNTAVTVTLTAVDDAGGSGVKEINIGLSGVSSGSSTVPGDTATEVISAEGATMLYYSGTDNAGNVEAANVLVVNIDLTPPFITAPPNMTVPQTIMAGAIVTYPPQAVVEIGSGLASSGCVPASGSTFPVGTTTVTCTATDAVGNTGSTTFTVTVTPAVTPAPDGRMYGAGFVNDLNRHHHFVFRVSQLRDRDWGRLEYWVNDSRRCGDDDAYDHGAAGDHDGNYGRDHRASNHFETTSIASVIFSDDPSFLPSSGARGRGGRRPTVDTVRFSGTGRWNGRGGGYTFEAVATDQGEPGRYHDTFSLVVKEPGGRIVASVSGNLAGGNIQSTRIAD